MTENNIRYIINGYYNNVPKSNFVKIDLSKIDRGVGDAVVGCWKRDKLHWIIMMDKVTILENKLDSNKYKFIDHFPVKDQGIPTLEGYTGYNCFELNFEYQKLWHTSGDIEK